MIQDSPGYIAKNQRKGGHHEKPWFAANITKIQPQRKAITLQQISFINSTKTKDSCKAMAKSE